MSDKTIRLWTYSLPAALALLAPLNVLASLGMDIYLPVVPAMPEVLGTTPGTVQLTLSLYMVMLGAGQILFGPLSDRLGRRPVLVCGCIVFAAASLALAATSSAGLFVLLRLVQAAGASAMLVAVFATIRDVYAQRPESTAIYSMMNGALAFVPAIGPVAGALVLMLGGWRAIFVVLAVPALVMLAVILPLWPETRRVGRDGGSAGFASVLKSLAFWTYTLGFGAAMGSFFVFFSIAPRVLIERAGFSELGFSLAFASVAVVMVAATRLAAGLVGRWGIPGSVARGMAMLIAGACLLSVGQVFFAPSFWFFVLPMWLVAIGIVFTVSVTANGALQEFAETAGTAVALHFCVQSLIVGVVGTGFVVGLDGDTAWPLIAYAATMAVLTMLALAWLHRRGPHLRAG
jgi:DHA1 family florfenicol/chloramphenicol resistance protein-like MFS transporter